MFFIVYYFCLLLIIYYSKSNMSSPHGKTVCVCALLSESRSVITRIEISEQSPEI